LCSRGGLAYPHGGRAHNSRSYSPLRHIPRLILLGQRQQQPRIGWNQCQSENSSSTLASQATSGGGCVGPHVSTYRMETKSPPLSPPGMWVTMTRWFRGPGRAHWAWVRVACTASSGRCTRRRIWSCISTMRAALQKFRSSWGSGRRDRRRSRSGRDSRCAVSDVAVSCRLVVLCCVGFGLARLPPDGSS
jgi:hypothetical protein